MLHKVIEKRQLKEVAILELDGKEDWINYDIIFPADRFVILPVLENSHIHEWGLAA